MPTPGSIVQLSAPFNPPILKGIKVHLDNPFRFDFILDKGDGQFSKNALKYESSKLIKYFLASLTVPEKDLWVNLSPYEKDRIIPNSFGLSEMGRDLLAEDYMLKQITASLIYPEGEIGKLFWKRIYEEAAKKFGTTNVPVNTFNKVWIVPQKAVVYENAQLGTAYVVESKLRVMLDQDYLSLHKHEGSIVAVRIKDTNQLGSQIVREIVIPELTKEVNQDKNFAQLRQVYNSLILATWYKKKIKYSILEQVYTDKNKVIGVNINDPLEKQRIYELYLQAFKKGVYNYIREEPDLFNQKNIPRKYFSGGLDWAMSGVFDSHGSRPNIFGNGNFLINCNVKPFQGDVGMISPTDIIPWIDKMSLTTMLAVSAGFGFTNAYVVQRYFRKKGKWLSLSLGTVMFLLSTFGSATFLTNDRINYHGFKIDSPAILNASDYMGGIYSEEFTSNDLPILVSKLTLIPLAMEQLGRLQEEGNVREILRKEKLISESLDYLYTILAIHNYKFSIQDFMGAYKWQDLRDALLRRGIEIPDESRWEVARFVGFLNTTLLDNKALVKHYPKVSLTKEDRETVEKISKIGLIRISDIKDLDGTGKILDELIKEGVFKRIEHSEEYVEAGMNLNDVNLNKIAKGKAGRIAELVNQSRNFAEDAYIFNRDLMARGDPGYCPPFGQIRYSHLSPSEQRSFVQAIEQFMLNPNMYKARFQREKFLQLREFFYRILNGVENNGVDKIGLLPRGTSAKIANEVNAGIQREDQYRLQAYKDLHGPLFDAQHHIDTLKDPFISRVLNGFFWGHDPLVTKFLQETLIESEHQIWPEWKDAILEINRIPPYVIEYIQKAAAEYHVPPEVLLVELISLRTAERSYTLDEGLHIMRNRHKEWSPYFKKLNSAGARLSEWFGYDLMHQNLGRWEPFLGAVLGGHSIIGGLRDTWVRRQAPELYGAIGPHSWMENFQLAWQMSGVQNNIRMLAMLLQRDQQELMNARSGKKPFNIASYLKEANSDLQFQAGPFLEEPRVKSLPNADELGPYSSLILLRVHPHGSWALDRPDQNQGKGGLGYRLFYRDIDFIPTLALVRKSGVFDHRRVAIGSVDIRPKNTTNKEIQVKGSRAMIIPNRGGIDFTTNYIQEQNSGEMISFHLDPAMLKQLQNAPGFVPVIINIQPITNLQYFLGISSS